MTLQPTLLKRERIGLGAISEVYSDGSAYVSRAGRRYCLSADGVSELKALAVVRRNLAPHYRAMVRRS